MNEVKLTEEQEAQFVKLVCARFGRQMFKEPVEEYIENRNISVNLLRDFINLGYCFAYYPHPPTLSSELDVEKLAKRYDEILCEVLESQNHDGEIKSFLKDATMTSNEEVKLTKEELEVVKQSQALFDKIRKEFEESHLPQKFWANPVCHGEMAFASWEYQLY